MSTKTPSLFQNDAFSSGQVGSKIWLIQTLEGLLKGRAFGHSVWVYGGWQGVLSFLLLSRNGTEAALPIDTIRSFDLDPQATDAANALCENWVWREWTFRAFTADCNDLDPVSPGPQYGRSPDIVINTSVEHFSNSRWFERIPEGKIVCLQAADFSHDGAESVVRTETELQERFPLSATLFSGSLQFDYESWGFKRFMLIGLK